MISQAPPLLRATARVAGFSTFLRVELRNRAFSDLIIQIVKGKRLLFLSAVQHFLPAPGTDTFLSASAVQLGLTKSFQSVGSSLPQARNMKGIIQSDGQTAYLHCCGFSSCCLYINSFQQSLERPGLTFLRFSLSIPSSPCSLSPSLKAQNPLMRDQCPGVLPPSPQKEFPFPVFIW